MELCSKCGVYAISWLEAMAGEKSHLLTGTNLFCSFFLLTVSLYFERWKQFVMVSLIWILLSERRYRFLYTAVKTAPRDFRALVKFLLTLSQFYYWNFIGGTTPNIFLANVRRHPNKIAFHFEDQTWTYQQVEDMSNRVANYFKREGVVAGDTIGLLMNSHPQVAILWLGLTKLRAVTALINNNQRTTMLSHSIQAGHCKSIICGSDLLDAMREVLPDWPGLQVYVSGPESSEPLAGSKHLDSVLTNQPTTRVPEAGTGNMNESFLLIYTSGTTGMPKAAKMSHARFFSMARSLFNMTWMSQDDVVYNTLPLYHTAGGLVGVGQVFLNGATVVIRNKFSVTNFWKDCKKYKCTAAQYIGEMCRFLLAAPASPDQTDHKVRLIFGNGLRPQIWQQFLERFNIKEVGEFYGSTEGNCNMINTENKVGAVGFLPWFSTIVNSYFLIKVHPDTSEPIRNEEGFCTECEYGEAGILVGVVKKSHPFSQFTGYADKSATEKKIIRDVFKRGDEYFNSGDILVKDELGYFYFKDRTGDTFRWRGENVATSEVEALISNIVGMKDAIVYGVEIPRVEGKAGMAAIVDTEGSLQLDALASGIKKALPVYARPLFIRVLECAPITGTFKLQKVELQKEGYNPTSVKDPLYFFNGVAYVPLTSELHEEIVSGKMKL